MTLKVPNGHYLIQIQAEDRDMTKLEQVFEAMLHSICQNQNAKSET